MGNNSSSVIWISPELPIPRQACSPLIQLFFGFASDIDQTNISRDIRDGNWLSTDTAIIPNAVIECFWNIDTARNFGSDWYFICMLIRSVL